MSEHHRKGLNRYGEAVEEARAERVVVLMTVAEKEAISSYQYENRIPTLAKAVRDLLGFALEQKGALK